MLKSDRSVPLYTLWGECLRAVWHDMPSRDGVIELLRSFKGVELSVKPRWFKDGIDRGFSAPIHTWVDSSGARKTMTFGEALAVIYELGLKLDLNWDPHNDGLTPGAYHQPPVLPSPYEFPFSDDNDRAANVYLLSDVMDAIEKRYPGVIARVTASNEPFYQPRWPKTWGPEPYGQWVLRIARMLADRPGTYELVACADTYQNQSWHSTWAKSRPYDIGWGVHVVFPGPKPGQPWTPEGLVADAEQTIRTAIAMRPDKSVDIHKITYVLDEYVPHGRHGSPDDPKVAAAYDLALKRFKMHGVGMNLLGVNGAALVCDPLWKICTGLVHPTGKITAAGRAVQRNFPAGVTAPPPTTPGDDDMERRLTKAEDRIDELEQAMRDILGTKEDAGLIRALSALSRSDALGSAKRNIMSAAQATLTSIRMHLGRG